jgi:erythromycin esterase-like protein
MWTRSAKDGGRSDTLVQQARERALPLRRPEDLDPLVERIGAAHYALLGEATHGTHEYYTWRAEITRRLIRERGFNLIAVEGDWPDCYRLNCYVRGELGSGESAFDVLHTFDRWPTWMWANREIAHLAEWLRDWNADLPEERKVGFFGLDVYSLWDSMASVTRYLEHTAPELARSARESYACFDRFGGDVQDYARATRWVPASCEHEVVSTLLELRRHAAALRQQDGNVARQAYFNAEQNALVAQNAEHYYRIMVRGGPDSWNLRDEHMLLTLDRLMQFHRELGGDSRAIVWAHNTHVGDARATDMTRAGMFNLGQLVRERHGADETVLVGFGSHRGSVVAGRVWDAPMERMPVPEAQADSWEDVLHRTGVGDQLHLLSPDKLPDAWSEARGHRAIGVVYDPRSEAFGNYVPTVLPERYDAFLFLDRTHALQALHLRVHDEQELPETFPSGV